LLQKKNAENGMMIALRNIHFKAVLEAQAPVLTNKIRLKVIRIVALLFVAVEAARL